MRISSLKYFVIDGLKSLKRNKTVSIAAMITVAASLFLMGIFLLSILNIGQGVKSVESKLEIQVFLKADIKAEEKNAIQDTLSKVEGVKELKFEDKKQALEKFKKSLGPENAGLVEGLEKGNPMPESYIVKVKDPTIVSKVVASIKDKPGIDKINDGRNVVEKIVSITNALKWIGIILFVICLVVSLFLIANTIKLTVYARRREINIMKYVGATDWFIRWPFIIEGILIGIIGAVIAIILIFYLYKLAYVKFGASSLGLIFGMVEPGYIVNMMTWKFVVAGVIIGALGSGISIRKFLKV